MHDYQTNSQPHDGSGGGYEEEDFDSIEFKGDGSPPQLNKINKNAKN